MVFNFRAIVRVLVAHEVEFAVVGGLAGVMLLRQLALLQLEATLQEREKK